MPDNGTQNYSLPINGSYTIQEGYHSGQGKVTQSITTMKGASVTPNTSVTTIATDQKYINGNFTIPAFALPSPSILKKGAIYTIYGKSVEGQFEGYVPGNADLYYKGQNPAGFNLRAGFGFASVGSIVFETATLRIRGVNPDGLGVNGCQVLCTASQYNFTPWNRINVELQWPDSFIGKAVMLYGSNLSTRDGQLSASTNHQGLFWFDISNLNITKYFGLTFSWTSNGHTSYINRIYFS